MNIYFNADSDKKCAVNLSNLKLDNNNRLYIRAVDNCGASSKFISSTS